MHETVDAETMRAAADRPRLTLDDAVTLALQPAEKQPVRAAERT